MSLVIDYWIGDVQDCTSISASEMPCVVSGRRSGGFKGGGRRGRPTPHLAQNFFSPKSCLFPYKRRIVRCVHLRQMTMKLIHCLPAPLFKIFWIRQWWGTVKLCSLTHMKSIRIYSINGRRRAAVLMTTLARVRRHGASANSRRCLVERRTTRVADLRGGQ